MRFIALNVAKSSHARSFPVPSSRFTFPFRAIRNRMQSHVATDSPTHRFSQHLSQHLFSEHYPRSSPHMLPARIEGDAFTKVPLYGHCPAFGIVLIRSSDNL